MPGMSGFEAAQQQHQRLQERARANAPHAHDQLPRGKKERFPMKTPKEARKAGESSVEYLYSNFAHYCQLVKRAGSFSPRDFLPVVRSRKEFQSLFKRANRYFRPYDVTDLVFKEYNDAATLLGLKKSERKKKLDTQRKDLKGLPKPEREKRLQELRQQEESLGEYRSILKKRIVDLEKGVTIAMTEASAGLATLVENRKAHQSLEILERLAEEGVAFPELPPDASDDAEKNRATLSLTNVKDAVQHLSLVQNSMRPLTEPEKKEDERLERFPVASRSVNMAIDEVNRVMQELSSSRLKTLSSAARQKHRVDSEVLTGLRGKEKREKRKELNAKRDGRQRDLRELKELRKQLLKFRNELGPVRRSVEKAMRVSKRDLPKMEKAIVHLAKGHEISEIPTKLLPLIREQSDKIQAQIKQGTTGLVGLPNAKREEIQREQRNYHTYLQRIAEDWEAAISDLGPRDGATVTLPDTVN